MAVSDSAEYQPQPSPSDLFNKIYDAVDQGDETELRTRLAQWRRYGFEQDINDCTLHLAISSNRADLVRMLMEYGVRADSDTAFSAVENVVSIDVWQALLDGGMDPNIEDLSAHPVIFNFLRDPSDESMMIWLLSHGASPEASSKQTGLSAISWTAGYGLVPILHSLLKHSGFTSADKLNRSNAVHEAARNKQEDRTAALALLVDELGADVNALSTYGAQGKLPPRFNRPECRPLHQAVRSGRREHVRFLLDRGARVTERDTEGYDISNFIRDTVNCLEGWKAIEEWFAEKGLEVPKESQARGEEDGDVARGNAEKQDLQIP